MAESPGMSEVNTKHNGFTLIELMMAIGILAILTMIVVPQVKQSTNKAELTDLIVRIDSMRLAMAVALQNGDTSMYTMSASTPGSMPPEITHLNIQDSMQYPGFRMNMMASDRDFGKFNPGTLPYLVIAADSIDDAATLRDLSEVMQDSMWAWWQPSAILVVPLLDTAIAVTVAGTPNPPGSTTPPGVTVPPVTTPPITTPPVTMPPTITPPVITPPVTTPIAGTGSTPSPTSTTTAGSTPATGSSTTTSGSPTSTTGTNPAGTSLPAQANPNAQSPGQSANAHGNSGNSQQNSQHGNSGQSHGQGT